MQKQFTGVLSVLDVMTAFLTISAKTSNRRLRSVILCQKLWLSWSASSLEMPKQVTAVLFCVQGSDSNDRARFEAELHSSSVKGHRGHVLLPACVGTGSHERFTFEDRKFRLS